MKTQVLPTSSNIGRVSLVGVIPERVSRDDCFQGIMVTFVSGATYMYLLPSHIKLTIALDDSNPSAFSNNEAHDLLYEKHFNEIVNAESPTKVFNSTVKAQYHCFRKFPMPNTYKCVAAQPSEDFTFEFDTESMYEFNEERTKLVLMDQP